MWFKEEQNLPWNNKRAFLPAFNSSIEWHFYPSPYSQRGGPLPFAKGTPARKAGMTFIFLFLYSMNGVMLSAEIILPVNSSE